MYEINLIRSQMLLYSSRRKIIFALKMLSLALTFLILFMLGLIAYKFIQMIDAQVEVSGMRFKIDEKRKINKVKSIEEEWSVLYYKLLAVDAIVKNATRTGVALRDVGLFNPSGPRIVRFEVNDKQAISQWVNTRAMTDDKFNINAYMEAYNKSYAKSSYLSVPVVIDPKLTIAEAASKKLRVMNVKNNILQVKK